MLPTKRLIMYNAPSLCFSFFIIIFFFFFFFFFDTGNMALMRSDCMLAHDHQSAVTPKLYSSMRTTCWHTAAGFTNYFKRCRRICPSKFEHHDGLHCSLSSLSLYHATVTVALVLCDGDLLHKCSLSASLNTVLALVAVLLTVITQPSVTTPPSYATMDSINEQYPAVS